MRTGKVELIEREAGQSWVLVHTRSPKDIRAIHYQGREELQTLLGDLRSMQYLVERVNVKPDTPPVDETEKTT